MLSALAQLNKASLTLTTAENGQINLAIFAEGKTPLALTFTPDRIAHAEQEVKTYCAAHSSPVVSSNLTLATQATAPTEAVSDATTAPEPTPQQNEVNGFEDDLMSEFGL
ncbi:hypothetical protein [Vibrio sp.]|uniref:hypothetical protein n=1 Tax=Vibrio sp. TaxID=678 RepID=UPI003D139824